MPIPNTHQLLDNETFFLYRLYSPNDTSVGNLYFCGYDNAVYGGIRYAGIPVQISDLRSSVEQQSEPTLTVGDLDATIGKLLILYGGIEGFIVELTPVKRRCLDDGTTPNYLTRSLAERYEITQLLSQTPDQLSFKLKNRVSAVKSQIPGRMLTNNCSWKRYRGTGCAYTGASMFDEFNTPVTDTKKDVCARTRNACSVRGNLANFGGIPTINRV